MRTPRYSCIAPSSRLTRAGALLAAALALGTPAQAYYHYVHYFSGGRSGPFTPQQEKFNIAPGGAVAFFVNDQGPDTYAAGDSFGSLLGEVKQAIAAWDSVSSPNLHVTFGGLETAGQTSTAGGADVVFQDLPPGLLGMGAPTSNGATIVRGTVILSDNTSLGAGPSYLQNFFTTAVHEVGHALGLQHTWTGSAMSQDVLRNTSRARPFDADDVAAINTLYGASGWQSNFGTISGSVKFANNSGVALASVVALSPTGAAVSALSNPDGSYRIEGIPAGNYLLYVHPLPPDAVPSDGSGLRLPVDQNGAPFQPSGAFGTIFYPNTLDPSQATLFTVSPGSSDQRNFTVQTRSAVPAYDLFTSSYLDPHTLLPLWDPSTVSAPIEIFPGIVNNTQPDLLVKVRANSGDTPVPQSATILGGFGVASGAYLVAYADARYGQRALALYFGMPPFAGTGPRHLVLNFGNDIYVLPQAINLVKKPAPIVTAARTNADGSVTVTGSNFGADSRVFFDGIQAVVQAPFSGGDIQGSVVVLPPPGNGGQTAQITVYNGDSQNSTFNQAAPPTYSYPSSPSPQLSRSSVNSLTAGSTAVVDFSTQNTAFVTGQVVAGFGTNDVTVQRVWVLSPTHILANISVAANANLGSSELSVVSGFEVMAQPGAFQILPANLNLPVIAAVTNGSATQQTVYPGVYATIYGVNLASQPAGVQITLNDQPVALQPNGVLPTQINFFIPANFPTGVAILKLFNGSLAANPIAVEIDVPPPTVLAATNVSGVPYDAVHFASAQDVVDVYVSALDPGVIANTARVQVTINGQQMPIQSVTQAPNGQSLITFVLNQSFGGVPVNLAVVVDGSSSTPLLVTVR
jgi:Matrixin/Carboxypeptidase regulatory-like domain/IPT/TIG domain